MKQIERERVQTLLVLGDVTDAKDNHSAELVNKVVNAFASLKVKEIKILAGNHDWLRKGQEFFRFLNVLPNVSFITAPEEDPDVNGPNTFYLPYSKQPAVDWDGFDFSHYEYVFMHQTVKGARSSNGQEMEGERLPDLSTAGKVYSGDIHVPQVIGAVEYVGSPYHVHFGDKFKPRCVLLERDGKAVDLMFRTISRVTVAVSSMAELEAQPFRDGDQLKVRYHIDEAERHDWARIRRDIARVLKAKGVEVHGIELLVTRNGRRLDAGRHEPVKRRAPAEDVLRFITAEEVGGDAYDAGMTILEAE